MSACPKPCSPTVMKRHPRPWCSIGRLLGIVVAASLAAACGKSETPPSRVGQKTGRASAAKIADEAKATVEVEDETEPTADPERLAAASRAPTTTTVPDEPAATIDTPPTEVTSLPKVAVDLPKTCQIGNGVKLVEREVSTVAELEAALSAPEALIVALKADLDLSLLAPAQALGFASVEEKVLFGNGHVLKGFAAAPASHDASDALAFLRSARCVSVFDLVLLDFRIESTVGTPTGLLIGAGEEIAISNVRVQRGRIGVNATEDRGIAGFGGLIGVAHDTKIDHVEVEVELDVSSTSSVDVGGIIGMSFGKLALRASGFSGRAVSRVFETLKLGLVGFAATGDAKVFVGIERCRFPSPAALPVGAPQELALTDTAAEKLPEPHYSCRTDLSTSQAGDAP